MSSGQQVWHTAVPCPSHSNPMDNGPASSPRTPSLASSPRTPSQNSSPWLRERITSPGAPHQNSSPGTPHQNSSPGTPHQNSSPWFPERITSPRAPHQNSSPGTPHQNSRPWFPERITSPGAPRQNSSPHFPSPSSSPRSPGTPGSERVASPLECSICFNGYDNIFKTPKELSCTHVFCLECLARLAAAQSTGHPGSEAVPCPFCRQPTAVPPAGAPALRTSHQLLAKMPAHLRREQHVWLEGTKLCCRPPPGPAAPGCLCVDVGLSKPPEPASPASPPGPAHPRGRLARCWARCRDWRRVALVATLLLVLFCVVLWPVQCALKTGNLHCEPRRPAALPTAPPFGALAGS
ncbi:RING finger protein 223 [Choloepus didactylus]|uniref:RING finger protein 223 n=1 Tax=Choloepus didactylus TaxID=27675 RepID=UPI00189F0F0B|nr:RING finger protein 223 [Choloepus didactylus]